MKVTNKMLTFLRKFLHKNLKIGLLYTLGFLVRQLIATKVDLFFFGSRVFKNEMFRLHLVLNGLFDFHSQIAILYYNSEALSNGFMYYQY